MSDFKLRAPKKKIKTKKKAKKRVSFLSSIFKTLFMMFLWGAMLGTLVVMWFAQDLPDIRQLQGSVRRPSVVIQTKDGSVIGTYGDLHEEVIKVQDLPPHVPQALMAVEDRRFYYHFGVDFIGLIRASIQNYKAGRVVQGGSTITQQLAKDFLFSQGLFPHNDRSYKRKIQEVLLALWLEWKFTKQQIMSIYLNRVYLGTGTYGIDAAAHRYFEKSARDLTVFEAAVIAGLLQAPSRYSPVSNPLKARKRAHVVLELMKEAGFINDYKKDLEEGTVQLDQIKAREEKGYRYFTDWIYETIPDYIGPLDKDIVVVTTLNPTYQYRAEKVVAHFINEFGKDLKTSQGALLAIRPNGAIVAMVGGASYAHSQFNRTTQSMRQPGSAFKPFVYLAALEHGLTPETMIEDTPVQIGNWSPKNFKYESKGEISLAYALAKSVNTVTARIALRVGLRSIIELSQRLGFTSDMPEQYSLTLGTIGTTMLELISAFSVFAANDGYPVWAYGIVEIRDKKGNILYAHEKTKDRQIIQSEHVQQIKDMLRGVIANGTGRGCNIDDTIIGKTGSNENKDAWFICYRAGSSDDDDFKNVVVATWVGNDDFKDMNRASVGSNLPLKITRYFLTGDELPKDLKQKPIKSQKKKAEQEEKEEPKEEDSKSSIDELLD